MKADANPGAKPRPNLFHFTRLPRPTVDRAGGIYLWDKRRAAATSTGRAARST